MSPHFSQELDRSWLLERTKPFTKTMVVVPEDIRSRRCIQYLLGDGEEDRFCCCCCIHPHTNNVGGKDDPISCRVKRTYPPRIPTRNPYATTENSCKKNNDDDNDNDDGTGDTDETTTMSWSKTAVRTVSLFCSSSLYLSPSSTKRTQTHTNAHILVCSRTVRTA